MSGLEVKNVSVSYKNTTALKAVSFHADAGEIIGFIGADGAGKSSLMHAVAGVGRFEGEIVYKGEAFHSPKEAEKFKKEIGLMPQGIGLVLYDPLTVGEHLQFFADIRNVKQDDAFKAYRQKLLHMAGLSDFVDREAGKLSGGMMQKLSLICTLLHRPRLLILDEPTTGVDPLSRQELWEILDEIRRSEGTIVLVSTAYMQEAAKMDRIFLFDEGEIIAGGDSRSLIDSVRPYTYAETACERSMACFSFDGRSYSLQPLPSPHAEPTLEALFFVNALKKGETPSQMQIAARRNERVIPKVVMEAKGLTKRFGAFVANDHIDMQLRRAQIVGLLGANGAGKTTFIKMLLGLYAMDEGELYLLEKPIRSGEDRRELKSKIGYVSQHFALYKDMTVRENLRYFAQMHRIDPKTALERIEKYASALGYGQYMDTLPGELPLGINQRFSITAALLHEPVILFLDEPTSGVDTIARAQFWQIMELLKEKWGISILITTHYMSEAEYCDRVVLLKEGVKVADAFVDELYAAHPNAGNFEEIFMEYYQ
ncbi:ATP-binding cassette domain-containing protein [Sulfurovum riftiae]|uniref:Response regulator receiver protein n=1 Tax=Sulfurovum riftiae TaxID=1630136 RepID=A0A151CGV7_9BACT|nr:ATP-binding cassette domain-containing protein [Sulfurovum riftiae]KYJ86741.1 response regulator receiver protein [Sulfurovum riftiae]